MRSVKVAILLGATMLAANGIAQAQTRAAAKPKCAPDNAGLKLPTGFCALVVADSVSGARHIAVRENGDVFVATSGRRSGGVVALRDTNGDGVADVRKQFGPGPGGNGITF